MSNPIPNQLALTSIPDGSQRLAAPIRNNYAAIQSAFNELIVALTGGASGQVLQAVDSSHVQWATSATTYRKTTAKQVVNTVAETDLLNGEITVSAGTLGTTGVLRLTARGDWKQNSGAGAPAPRFKLKLGGVTLLDTGAMTLNTFGNNASRFGWRLDVTIDLLGAASSQWAHMSGLVTGIVSLTDNSPFTVGEGGYWTPTTGSNNGAFLEGANAGAVDTTVACPLVLSVINGTANANYDVTLKSALVEVL